MTGFAMPYYVNTLTNIVTVTVFKYIASNESTQTGGTDFDARSFVSVDWSYHHVGYGGDYQYAMFSAIL